MKPADAARHKKRAIGDEGVWFFITADISMFAVFFFLFMDGRSRLPALFEESRRTLDVSLGLANTLILLTSSYLMALAVQAARERRSQAFTFNAVACLIVGSGFAISKVIEYSTKIGHGVTLRTNEFFSYYFIFTGIHFLHFVVGVVTILSAIFIFRRREMNTRNVAIVEAIGCYWHMVDLLWLVLFAMIYLMRPA